MSHDQVEAIRAGLSELRNDVADALKVMRNDIKELGKAINGLARIDARIERLVKDVDALFGLVREETRELDARVRKLEVNVAGNAKSMTLFDSIVRQSMFVIVGVIVGVVVERIFG